MPNWKKVIVSGSDAILSDVTIDDWGSVSASLASIEAGAISTNLQDVTDNGNTTTNDIIVGGDVRVGNGPGNDSSNVIVGGSGSFSSNVGSSEVVVVGAQALTNGVYSDKSTAIGFRALYSEYGDRNTAVGAYAMQASNITIDNTSVGAHSLNNLQSGDANAVLGFYALGGMFSGSRNTAIGDQAGFLYEGGGGSVNGYQTDSIFIGHNTLSSEAGTALALTSNEIVIGAYATGSGTNTVTIGNPNITDNYFSGNISGSDVTIDDWGSVSASLASIEASATSTTLQEVTDNGNTTTNDIIVAGDIKIHKGPNSLLTSIAIGSGSLQNDASFGGNIAIGLKALGANTTGDANIAIGFNALSGSLSGNSNIALGYNSLLYNTTGTENTAIGDNAMRSNTTGDDNTALGRNSLGITSGDGNVALGYNAHYGGTNSNYNTSIGFSALYGGANTGGHSVAIGAHSAGDIPNNVGYTKPTDGVYIGAYTIGSAEYTTNEIVIGAYVTGSGNNTVTIGNSNITNNYFSGDIDADDITIDGWGSVSASLASLEASSAPTLQQVTDNGNTTTNSITVAGLTSTDKVTLGSANNDVHEVTGSIYLSDGGANLVMDGAGFEVYATSSALNAGFAVSGSKDGYSNSDGDILIAGHSTIYTPWSDKGSYNKLVQSNPSSLLEMDTRYYIGAVIHYTAYSSDYSNIRTGTISLAFNSTTFTLNETSTTDVGDTDSLTFDAYLLGTPKSLYLRANFSNTWNISLDYTFLRKAEFKNGILNYTIQDV